MSATTSGGKYTRDLKLRVLEHYFRNGGDVFGNKQATAKKFGVDSKTINRFLKIHDLVRLARKNAKSKSSTSSSGGFKTPATPPAPSGSRSRPPVRQAVRISQPERTDESVVNQTAAENTSSISKLIKVFELGTQEIRDLLLAECDLIYECRVCRGLFRNLANLLTHKRRFCTRPHADTRQVFGAGPGQSLSAPADGVLLLPPAPAAARPAALRRAEETEARAAAAEPLPTLRLEAVPGTGAAVFQTLGEQRSVGERVQEVHGLEAAAGRTVRLASDGRVLEDGEGEEEEEPPPEEDQDAEDGRHVCKHCNTTFSTRKTLSHHIRSLHSSTRIYYPCTCCSAAFINMFSVERHLQKVHKKKQDEIETLKEVIKQKSFHRNVTEAQAATPTANPNMPKKVGPPAVGLRCSDCQLCYPSAQLLAAHQLTAHARTAERVPTAIQARCDYLTAAKPRPPVAASALLEPSASSFAASVVQRHTQAAADGEQESQGRLQAGAEGGKPAKEKNANAKMEAKMNALCDLSRLKCKQCGSLFPNLNNLKRHAAGHIGWTRHGCPRCTFRAYDRYDAIRHLTRAHGVTRLRARVMLQRHEAHGGAAAEPGTEPGEDGETEPAREKVAAEARHKEYEMRDLAPAQPKSAASSPGSPSSSHVPFLLLPGPSSRPVYQEPPPDPFARPQTPPAAEALEEGRRSGRKTLTSIIHYIRARSESVDRASDKSTSQDSVGKASDQDQANDSDDLDAFMSLWTGAELEPGAVWRTLPPLVPLDPDPPSAGAQRGPRGHRLPLLGRADTVLLAGRRLLGSGRPRRGMRRRGFAGLLDSAEPDCNENTEHSSPEKRRLGPAERRKLAERHIFSARRSAVKFASARAGGMRRTLSDPNFFPRVLLRDIGSDWTRQENGFDHGSSVRPGARSADPVVAGGALSPKSAARGRSPSRGGPVEVRRGRGRPRKHPLRPARSESDLPALPTATETPAAENGADSDHAPAPAAAEKLTAPAQPAAAATGEGSEDGESKKGPFRPASAKLAFTPGTKSPGSTPPKASSSSPPTSSSVSPATPPTVSLLATGIVHHRHGGPEPAQKTAPSASAAEAGSAAATAAAATVAAGSAAAAVGSEAKAEVTGVTGAAPAEWAGKAAGDGREGAGPATAAAPLVRKRSWSTPSQFVVSAADEVKRRRRARALDSSAARVPAGPPVPTARRGRGRPPKSATHPSGAAR